MKRIGLLYEKISEPDNIRLAFCKASKGKSNSLEVVEFKKDFEKNILNLYKTGY